MLQTVTSSSTLTPGPAGPVSFRDGANVATASAAHKHAPSDAYELEDLDEDWVAMLNVLDNRLLEVRLHELICTLVLLCAASSNRSHQAITQRRVKRRTGEMCGVSYGLL